MTFSFRRLAALLRKEWAQMKRDALTLRFIVAVPIMQLFLFGYAINTNPQHLPTGLLSVEHSKYERTVIAALRNSGYYDIRTLGSEAEAERALAQGEVLFVIEFPPNFDRAVDRGGVAGDDDLIRRVEIGGAGNFPLRNFFANLVDFIGRQRQHRCHGAHTNRHGLLHVFAAIAHGAYGIDEGQRPGGHMRGIFS